MMSGHSRKRPLAAILIGSAVGVTVALMLAFGIHQFDHQPADLHARLHQAVPLDPQESQFLEIKEREFARRRQQIEGRLQTANEQLATAIARDPRWSPDVEAATRYVEQAAADLQRATLVHIFEMRSGLKPEHRATYDTVLVNALRHGTR